MDSNYGKKYACFKCGSKFYDLNKEKAICPKCQSDQSLAPSEEISQNRLLRDLVNMKKTETFDEEKPDNAAETIKDDFSINAVATLNPIEGETDTMSLENLDQMENQEQD